LKTLNEIYKIGEVFELNGKDYIVEIDERGFCEGCSGEGSLCKNFPECDSDFRCDGVSVIFVEIG
jgi:hypothetical protein